MNLEIALTQNLYESLLKAKSKHLHEQDLTQSYMIDSDERLGTGNESPVDKDIFMSFFPKSNSKEKGRPETTR